MIYGVQEGESTNVPRSQAKLHEVEGTASQLAAERANAVRAHQRAQQEGAVDAADAASSQAVLLKHVEDLKRDVRRPVPPCPSTPRLVCGRID